MNQETISGIALAGFAIVLVCGYIRLFLKKPSRKQRFIEKAKTAGNCATATLIANKRHPGNDESGNSYFKFERMKNTYEYRVNGKAYRKKLVFQSPGMTTVRYPYTVTVYYNPKRPSRGICREECGERGAGCLTSIVFAVLTFLVIYNGLKLL